MMGTRKENSSLVSHAFPKPGKLKEKQQSEVWEFSRGELSICYFLVSNSEGELKSGLIETPLGSNGLCC